MFDAYGVSFVSQQFNHLGAEADRTAADHRDGDRARTHGPGVTEPARPLGPASGAGGGSPQEMAARGTMSDLTVDEGSPRPAPCSPRGAPRPRGGSRPACARNERPIAAMATVG